MLYATTRNSIDAFTAQRVLTQKRGPEGGLFVPFRLNRLSEDEIAALGTKSFNANLAAGLNLLFNSQLTSYDIDLAMGRQSVRLQQLGQKILMGECWHNTSWQFSRMVSDLTRLVCTEEVSEPVSDGWAELGIRIAVLFGIFGALIREGLAGKDKVVDISVLSGDFTAPMAAWYGRNLGLPIGNIVCCCNDNSRLWDFICHGQLKTDGVAKTTLVPEGDILVPDGLERLICAYGGPMEVQRYVDTVRRGGTYYVEDSFLHRMRQGIYVTVSSDKRIAATIPGAWATHRYVLTPAGALCYSGLQDYRTRTGTTRTSLILTEKSPSLEAAFIAQTLGMEEQELCSKL